jgi:uncharacterized repeat protein (TIGR01451 family)
VCANVFRFVGNDPGVPGRLNLNWNPQFRTIAADFEAIPGLIVPSDLAPTQVGIATEGIFGNVTTLAPVRCDLDPLRQPQLHAVTDPWVDASRRTLTIRGLGFGAGGLVTLDGVVVPTTAWSDTQIDVSVPAGHPVGPHQLEVTRSDTGLSTVNGLTLHVLGGAYNPQRFEVGPGRAYAPAETLPATANHAIQNAIDAAATFVAASAANAARGALVVVYPNVPSADPRQNPRGAYYENLILHAPVKLQGVGPGSPDGAVRGSIVDGLAFGGDSPVSTDWYVRMGTLAWAGNQTVFDASVISIFVPSTGRSAFPTAFDPATAPSIDGFDLRGGNQVGFPNNIDPVTGLPTGQPGGLVTQGGAIYANGYARNLQVTNNVVQNNGGAYGTIRIGNPDLPAPLTDNQNDGVRILNNRILANAGTNLAGGIGIFSGANGYEVAFNDVCGNFSAEYGGGIGHYGLSPGGRIHHNRIYFNRSYDEGGGVMIAGALPVVATADYGAPGGPQGSGAVDIYANLIQANIANDDGGGIRFLMAGNFPMNVHDNFIVNNVSTHEGGGVSLNDAPDVRFHHNTVMKNLTTATAVTSTGIPAPAGLSSSAHSDQLQRSLPAGAPTFSDPLLFNDVFWDNRAGTRSGGTVTGLGNPGDVAPVDNWDLGVADGTGLLSPTNSVLQTNEGVVPSPSNASADPGVVQTYDVHVSFDVWRNNPAFIGAILAAVELPPNLMGDYHLAGTGSPAFNLGAASKGGVAASASDADGDGRPARGGFDAGADEIPDLNANLGIAKTDGVAAVQPGQLVTYTLTVTNAGPGAAIGATVTDALPSALTGATWTCAASAGSSCGTASGSGSLQATVNLSNGGSATFTLTATVSPGATGSLSNTASVAPPAGMADPVPGNNSATDTDAVVVVAFPALPILDTFNRASTNNLNTGAPAGVSWSQLSAPFVGAALRVNATQAYAASSLFPYAMWNSPTTGFGARQAAEFAFANAPGSASWLILKGSGGSAARPMNFIRVMYAAGTVSIATTTNLGISFTARTSFPAAFAAGDRMTALAEANGRVSVWRTSGAASTLLGTVVIPTSGAGSWPQGTGGGRIGLQLSTGARVDDFRGATVP